MAFGLALLVFYVITYLLVFAEFRKLLTNPLLEGPFKKVSSFAFN